jgi:hypothetical protein
MPWVPKDATSHTKKATSPITKRQFAHVANKVLEQTGDEGRAMREANAAVAKRKDGGSHKHGTEQMHPHDPYAAKRK